MNRYKPGGPSKATSTTLCQKCLKKGHYSYECTSAQQERPYTSRPSRTQQLLDPKLAPKITEMEQTQPKMEFASSPSNGTSRDEGGWRNADDRRSRDKHPRSASVYSSDSVSTISTNASRSRSQTVSSTKPRRRISYSPQRTANRSPDFNRSRRRRSRSRSPSHGPVHRGGEAFRERDVDDTSRLLARAEPSKSSSQSEQMAPRRKRSPSPFSARRALARTMEPRR